jgi:hypothetical protein
MRRARTRLGLAGLALAALAARAPVARAQWSGGIDLQMASRYRWRGITRTQASVIQPSIDLTWRLPCPETQALCGSLSGGAWASWQVSRAGVSELSDLAPGRRGFSEWDWWGEVAAHHELLDAAAGVVHYIYPSTDAGALRTPADNTTELYTRLRLPRVPIVKPSVVAWLDVDHVKGVYVEASAITGLKLLPTGANLDLGATAGVSLGQDSSLARPSEGFNSARRGLTYLELTLGPSGVLGALHLALDVHLQWSFDDLTRRASRTPGVARDSFLWWTLTAGWAWECGR